MKTSTKIMLSLLLIAIDIVYFGYEATLLNLNKITSLLFINLYLDNYQKYLLIISTFFCVIMFALKIPFLQPEFRVRIGNSFLNFIFKYIAVICISLSLYVLLMYVLVIYLFNFEIQEKIRYLYLFLELVSFFIVCMFIFLISYFKTVKLTFSIMTVWILNFLFLVIINCFGFWLNKPVINILGLKIYKVIIIIYGTFFLLFKAEKTEIIT